MLHYYIYNTVLAKDRAIYSIKRDTREIFTLEINKATFTEGKPWSMLQLLSPYTDENKRKRENNKFLIYVDQSDYFVYGYLVVKNFFDHKQI